MRGHMYKKAKCYHAIPIGNIYNGKTSENSCIILVFKNIGMKNAEKRVDCVQNAGLGQGHSGTGGGSVLPAALSYQSAW